MNLDLRHTWIIADSHFGHDNIMRFCHRPEDHTRVMVDAWREAVPTINSTLLHLGDLTYRGKQKFIDHIAPRLTGERKLLMLGNHDKADREYYDEAGFEIIKPFEMNFEGRMVEFDHYPHDSRQDGWDHPPENTWRVHGHIHNNGYGPPPVWPHVPYMLRQINVSAEMLKYRPVNLDVLLRATILGELP